MVQLHLPTLQPLRKPARTEALSGFASTNLDAARALAAQVVMLGHIRVLFFVDYDEITHTPGVMEKVMYWMSGLQHESVVVFLVLSGMLISRNIAVARRNGVWRWRNYLTDRFLRLYMVLVPGLLAGCILDSVGATLGVSRWFYTGSIGHFPDMTVIGNLTIGTFFANLAFLQTILCQPFGSNLPLWSLACEFWYYLLYPLLLFGWLEWRHPASPGFPIGRFSDRRSTGREMKDSRWKTPALRATAYLALAGLILMILDKDKVIWFLIWLLGCAVWAVSQKWQPEFFSSRTFMSVGALLLVLSISFARTRYVSVLYSDIFVGFAAAILMLGVLRHRGRDPWYSRLATATAGFSYSEYIVHFPLLVFLRASLGGHALWQPDAVHRLYAAGIATFTLGYAYAFSRLTEAKTTSVRHWFRNRRRLPYDIVESTTQHFLPENKSL
jgi:peptidoglycan/LPS O-acetylase OafA/YrhL